METQTPEPAQTAADRSTGPSPVTNRILSRESSFVRSGSGRKLPQIPERSRSNTLPSRPVDNTIPTEEENSCNNNSLDMSQEDDIKNKANTINGHSKPKAMEFWESMENIERADFRYNTIHRMSVGRRMLPKPPSAGGDHSRSASVDRGSHETADKTSLNSSFSGPSSLPINSVPASPRVLHHHNRQPDGASLQSECNSDLERRDGEGSSDKNSPPTSVVLGVGGGELPAGKPSGLDWFRGGGGGSSYKWGGEEGAGKWGEEGVPGKERNVPYSVLLQELNQAKKQLQELYNLVRFFFSP